MLSDVEKYLLNSLFIQFQVSKNLEEILNKRFGEKFNIFRTLDLVEDQISNFISELLNPCGTHGQGTKFLELFLKELQKIGESKTGFPLKNVTFSKKLLKSAKVEREHKFEKGRYNGKNENDINKERRIDIFIRLPEFLENGDFCIAIENKPWAKEQHNQIEDYVSYLEKLKDSKDIKDFIFLYLAENRQPEIIDQNKLSDLQEKGRFLTISYTEFLVNWLKLCKKNAQAEKLKIFIEDFINWVLEKFEKIEEGGSPMVVEGIKNWILGGGNKEEKARFLYEIHKNFQNIIKQRFKEFLDKLQRKIKNEYKEIKCCLEEYNVGFCLWIYDKNWNKWETYLKNLRIINFAFQIDNIFDEKEYKCFIGLSRPAKENLNYENYNNLNLKEKFEKIIQKVKNIYPNYISDKEWWVKNWWILYKTEKIPDPIFKIFNPGEEDTIVEKWYKEVKELIDLTKKELDEFLTTTESPV